MSNISSLLDLLALSSVMSGSHESDVDPVAKYHKMKAETTAMNRQFLMGAWKEIFKAEPAAGVKFTFDQLRSGLTSGTRVNQLDRATEEELASFDAAITDMVQYWQEKGALTLHQGLIKTEYELTSYGQGVCDGFEIGANAIKEGKLNFMVMRILTDNQIREQSGQQEYPVCDECHKRHPRPEDILDQIANMGPRSNRRRVTTESSFGDILERIFGPMR